ncbi:cytochrome c [Pedobacter sp. ok626]|uniref:PQQ-dependent sugar dehydrogenase n=1 Tax=Pedobacter sp. ok626 TaxID=1761882 RepID=UPI00088C0E21|nr:PQQ-dependent sugar dehydrogenase [Pedobacter sp. ok626]SDK26333.1 cytochrome c [Pedobacter sp. ok626]
MFKRIFLLVVILGCGFLFISPCSAQQPGKAVKPIIPAGITSEGTKPDENRFALETLNQKILEPMQLAITPDLDVIYIERRGAVRMYKPESKKVKLLGTLDVHIDSEDGLLGLAMDPNFKKNGWIYLFYSPTVKRPAGEKKPVNEVVGQRVSRFKLSNEALDLSSEKILIEIPVIRGCCHSAGSLEFGPGGNLFIGVGDNTNPSMSSGYSPIDQRDGRLSYDAQKSAANTHDLRGKILRIKPADNGSYTIPDGNLFPKDGSKGRPEIYVMGNRNPYRISIDQKNGYLYWGEIGPDAGVDSLDRRGPRGYDEFNQAKAPGNFGWPYFIGNNIPYTSYDFATGLSGKKFDPAAPVNLSVNNTGSKNLPPAQPAFLWYPYTESPEFPIVGNGGRSSMAGPVYYRDLYKNATHLFPTYYNGKVFIFDWARNWIMTVSIDDQGRLKSIEPFMPSTKFSKPIYMKFGPDGALYILEYGNFWKSVNDDSRLVKIQFYENNRRPVAKATADKPVGAVPLKVRLSAEHSFDYDKGDKLTYLWQLANGSVLGKTQVLEHTFNKAGLYKVSLTVTDQKGEFQKTSLEIKAGNEAPQVNVETNLNRTFYWANQEFTYAVKVNDKEDGVISQGSKNAADVKVRFDYLPEGKDLILLKPVSSEGHSGNAIQHKGSLAMAASDCNACHAMDKRTVGPSFMEIAARYKIKDKELLIRKVKEGGSGSWGEVPMSAHPQVTKAAVSDMIDYILGLSKPKDAGSLPMNGTLKTLKQTSREGVYYFTASYTDKGANGMPALTATETLVLRNATLLANNYDTSHVVMNKRAEETVRFTKNGAYIVFKGLDLMNIKSLTVNALTNNLVGTLEIRTGSENGPVIGSKYIDLTKKSGDFEIPIEPVKGLQNLYFVYKTTSKEIGIWIAFDIKTITFNR